MLYEKEILIRESHLDTFGHVNNAAYLTIFEEARWDIIASHGFGMNEIREYQVGPTILEVNVRFRREIRLRELITIRTEFEPMTGKIGVAKQWMINKKNEVCCEAEFKVGLFDLRTRRLIDPTPEWRRAIGLPATT
jgi:YbgC/YbaW family acyl-CoA thioester hydrolase